MKRAGEQDVNPPPKRKTLEEMTREAQELQKRIEQKMSKITPTTTLGSVILNSDGQLVDKDGNIIQTSHKPIASTITNLNKQKESKTQLKLENPTISTDSPFFDPNISQPRTFRKKKEIVFNQQGKFIHQGDLLRAYQDKKKYQSENQQDDAMEQDNIPKIGDIQLQIGQNEIPTVEWWDDVVLNDPKCITHLIEHPIPIKSAEQHVELLPMPLMLTEKERKKLRTKSRLAKQLETQKKIKLGLIPAPPPKANLKNFMKVYLNDATIDPTRLEQKIKKEIEKRKEDHEKRNQESKLTPEEKKEKRKRKATEDAAKGIESCLFKISKEIVHPGIKFKINAQAREKFISGCVLYIQQMDYTILIGEAGPKYLHKFVDIMANKTDWNRRLDESKEEEKNIVSTLLWKGSVTKKSFKGFQFLNFDTLESASEYLKKHDVMYMLEFAK